MFLSSSQEIQGSILVGTTTILREEFPFFYNKLKLNGRTVPHNIARRRFLQYLIA